MPNRPQFPGQHPDEEVVFKQRRHWWIFLRWAGPPLLLFTVTVSIGIGIGLAFSLSTLVWAGLVVLLSIAPLGLTIWRFLDWENDHYILTNQRVLHIERVYFLFESRDEASLDRIQDVAVTMPTLTANLLSLGDVEIETASATGLIKFESIAKPREIQRLILKQAGLPEPTTKAVEEWRANQPLILRPLAMLVQMFYPIYPTGGNVQAWRKHWFFLLTKMMRPLLAALLLLVVWVVILLTDPSIPLQFIPGAALKAIPGGLLFILAGWIAWIAIDWHNDIYVLTDTHVIDIEKRPFTLEFRREANLGMIQNVSYEQPSFLAKLLDFGNTRLETAGTMGEFTFDSIPNPREVQTVIIQRLAEFRRRTAKPKPKPAPRTQEELEKTLADVLSKRYGLLPQQSEPAEEQVDTAERDA